MSNTTPEWASINPMVRDEMQFNERKRAKQSKRLVKRLVIAVIATALGVGTGLVGQAVYAQHSDAASQTAINQYIRDHGGIPPCRYEDGSGQPGACYWNGGKNNKGDLLVMVPTRPGHDKRAVILVNR